MMVDLEKQQHRHQTPFFISEKALLAGRDAGLIVERGFLETATTRPSAAAAAAAAWHSHPLTMRRAILIVGMMCVVGTLSVVHLIRGA